MLVHAQASHRRPVILGIIAHVCRPICRVCSLMQMIINTHHLWIRLGMFVTCELSFQDVITHGFQGYRILRHEDRRWPIVVERRHLEFDGLQICTSTSPQSIGDIEYCVAAESVVPQKIHQDAILAVSEPAVLVPGGRESIRIDKPHMHMHGVWPY